MIILILLLITLYSCTNEIINSPDLQNTDSTYNTKVYTDTTSNKLIGFDVSIEDWVNNK